MKRTPVALMLAVVTCLVLTGCGPQGPVEFGTLEVSDTTATMPETTAGQLTAVEEWPDACQFLTEDEVKSLLPQGRVRSRSVTVDVVGIGAGAQEGVAPAGQCAFEIGLPGTDSTHEAQIWVSILAVGDPRTIARNLDSPPRDVFGESDGEDNREDHGSDLGPQRCFMLADAGTPSLTPTVRCRQGALEFDVRGAPGSQTDIRGADSERGRSRIFYENVIVPSVKAVAAKVPAT